MFILIAVPTAANAESYSYDYKSGYFDTECKSTDKRVDNNLGDNNISYTSNFQNLTVNFCGLTSVGAVYVHGWIVDFQTDDKNLRLFLYANGAVRQVVDVPIKRQSRGTVGMVYLDNVVQADRVDFGITNNTATFKYAISEIEVFKYAYKPVTNVSVDVKTNSAIVNFTPADANYKQTNIYLNDKLITTSGGSTTLNYLTPNTTYKLNVQVEYADGTKIDTVKEFKTLADTTPPDDVATLDATIVNKKDVKLTYVLPTDQDFSHLEIYRGDKLLTDSHKESSYTDTTTTHDNNYTYKIVAVDTTGNKSAGISKTIKTSAQTAANVSNLYAAIDGKKDVKLSYKLAGDTSYVQIYRDNKLLVDNYKETSYTDKNTAYNTSYVYKVAAVNDDGLVATGTSKTIKTPQSPPKDASSLSYTATSNSVSLKWRNTTLDDFTAVTIYRKNNTVAANVRALFSAGDGYTKLHSGKVETYTDNSVEPDTSYKYKITTTIAGVESDGVTVDVKTKPVTLDDTTLEQQPNGDYVVTWGAPTTGKMQINVGGTKYAVVPAANKTFTIPAADVKFNSLGFADVQLVPLNDAEQPVGPGTKPGGGGLGSIIGGAGGEGIFDAPDLVKAAASLLALVGGFILLGLAFRVVPMLVKTIRNAFISGGAKR